MPTMTYSPHGLALTKQFEGLRLTAYRDCANVLTIGYGHTGPINGAAITPNQTITEPEAETLLRSDLADAIACVNLAVHVPLTQNQFDALVDFCFNAGRGAFLGSTLLRKLNAGDLPGAAAQFPLWVHAGGHPVEGLIRRRKAEAEMFASVA